ncbi:hypothetical protein NCS55_00961800 [Fusarium keratoplasticum]|nr:hypothetical protein NCS55_00961800 [Fusarium keratoplasticum]
MGQRHQLFVIARVGKHYRSLAAVHHQWLYGVSALRSCLRLLRIFSDPGNHLALKHELDLAASFFKDKPPPPSEPEEYRDAESTTCPVPFITTCLAIGASYDSKTGQVQAIHELRYDMGYDQGDNNDGITVIDITDLDHVRYCFVNFGNEDDEDSQSELRRVGLSNKRMDAPPFDNFATETPLTGREYLRGYYSESDEMVQRNMEVIEALDNTPLVEEVALATDAKLFDRLLTSTDDDFDPSLLDEVRNFPGFQRMVKEYLLSHPEKVGPTQASAHLLQLAYAGEDCLEWNLFTKLDPKTIKAALTSDALKGATGISLTALQNSEPAELLAALSSLDRLHTLQVLDRPDREDEGASNRLFEALAKSDYPLALKKLTLTGLYANGIRQNIWRPYRDQPKTLEAFPVVQLLVLCLLSYNGTGLQCAHCFSCGPSALGEDKSSEIAALPTETYTIAKGSYHSSAYKGVQSKLQDLTPDSWMAVVSKKSDTEFAGVDSPSTTRMRFKYAFVRSKATIQVDQKHWRGSDIQPTELEVVDIKEFLHKTTPEVDTSKLAYHVSNLEDTLVQATRARTIVTTPDEEPLFSSLSPDEACVILNKFVGAMPQVQKSVARGSRWGIGEDAWISKLGFDADEKD